ncbi:unnamed protein product [Hymenolepis diminuta]|uniref:Uncharacterized protein n=1 Tax=Hymenolepis diminuta TaxID=6216 RepID=A0A564Z0Q6_HYMDI|nr:unnamed protein product [Hymenolepis diminuta]
MCSVCEFLQFKTSIESLHRTAVIRQLESGIRPQPVDMNKPTAASEERGKRKSVQISDGKQLDEEDEEAQPTTSREKRRLSRGSCANSDLDVS